MPATPIAPVIQVADAVVAQLTAHQADFSLPFTPVRLYKPIEDLKQLAVHKVSVIPAGWTNSPATRGSMDRECVIHVGIQKKLAGEQIADIDPLVNLLSEIEQHFESNRRLETMDAAYFRRCEATIVPLDDADLYEKRLFTAVVAFVFLVTEDLP